MAERSQDEDGRHRPGRDFAVATSRTLGAAARASRSAASCSAAGCRRRPASAAAFSARTIASSSPASASAARGTASSAGSPSSTNVEIKTLCDIDANLAPERVNDPARSRTWPPTSRDSCRTSTASWTTRISTRSSSRRRTTGMRWRRSGPAGRQARLRREAGVSHRVGRAQDGGSRHPLQQGGAGRHDEPQPPGRPRRHQVRPRRRHRQGLHGARALLQAPRLDRQISGRPHGPGETYKLNVESAAPEPPYDEQDLSKVDYDMWLGPAPKRPFNRNRFHYNWHWHWDYGNGDSGNQGPHQFDIARWGLTSRSIRGRSSRPAATSVRNVAGDAGHADVAVRIRRRHDPRVRHPWRVHERRRRAADREPVLRHQGLGLD